jgi:hypothetical protein
VNGRRDGARASRRAGAIALALLAAAPAAAHAGARLLDCDLAAPLVALAADEVPAPKEESGPQAKPDLAAKPAEQAPSPGSLEFDLLGAPPPQPQVDEGALRLRRTMLTLHQGIGFGLVALQLATTIVGQLNYSDRFANGPSTGKYQLTHAALAYSTLVVFAGDGLLALLAPAPPEKREGLDRVTLHKIAMLTAAAGMVAEGVLGVATTQREGYLNQPSFATAHLVVGYVTLAAVLSGVGVLVF